MGVERRMSRIGAWAALVACLGVGEPTYARSDGEMAGSMIPRVPPSPPLATHLTFDHPASRLGWGSFDLAAAPEVDEIEVRITVGAPVLASRWGACSHMRLSAGILAEDIALRHIEVSMDRGVYEAVTGRLSIEDLRRMSAAGPVRAEVCADRFELQEGGTRALSEFVRDFDDRALYDGPPPPPPPPELGPEGEWTTEPPADDVAPA